MGLAYSTVSAASYTFLTPDRRRLRGKPDDKRVSRQ
jgi:hypothetical protein